MLSESRFSYLIEVTENIVIAVNRMSRAYLGFPELVDAEHEMIQQHEYTSKLEETQTRKSELAEEIGVAFNELQQLAGQLFLIWNEAECEGQASFPGDLGNCIRMVEGIRRGLEGNSSTLAVNVLDAQIRKLRESHQLFSDMISKVKGKIELNRTALTAIVQNYQKSTRFLIELCEQSQATYNPGGQTQKPSTGTSTIYVKA